MMKVIKYGKVIRTTECPECYSVLEYDDADIISAERRPDGAQKIKCPVCKHIFKI